jgi:hypothetical protein
MAKNQKYPIISAQKANSSIINNNLQGTFKPSGEGKIVQSLLKKNSDLKSKILPLIIQLNSLFSESCPNNIQDIINKRNNLVSNLNTIYNIIDTLSKSIQGINGFLQVIKTLIPIFNTLPLPLQFSTAGIVITLKESQDLLKEKLNKLTTITDSTSIVLVVITSTLKNIIDELTKLDNNIKNCSTEQNIPFVSINNDINNLTSPTVVNSLQDQQVNYKGFTLEVIIEPQTGDNQYPKRRAIARNSLGIIILQGEPSFASDIQVLINELKFIIDSNNLESY